MTGITFAGSDGATWAPEPDVLEALKGQLRGALCYPGDAGYEQARTLWNAMVDKRPGAVVRAAGAADVMRAVNVAREHRLLLSVRGGGHGVAGHALCDGGLTLDLSPMRSVRIDPARRTARVEPGVTLGELDKEAQAFGLAVPLGINSTTGVSGLVLGGGFGWLSRKLGMTIDHLVSADVVLARGALVHASAAENEDLFWAIRGGGGNFGVVTSFELGLSPVGPQVTAGLLVHPFEQARELLPRYQRAVLAAPDDLSCWVVLRRAPPLPFLPPEVHGRPILVLALCYVGDEDGRERALAPIRELGRPLGEMVGPMPFLAWQQALDPLLAPGWRNYWKSHDFVRLEDGALDVILDEASRLPSPDCEVVVAQLGGAVNRVPATATAYPHRSINFVVNVHARWGEASQDAACIGWARQLFDRLAPFATGGVYVNFMPADEAARVAGGAYGANYDRLAQLKAEYDPDNLFRGNQNIQPATRH